MNSLFKISSTQRSGAQKLACPLDRAGRRRTAELMTSPTFHCGAGRRRTTTELGETHMFPTAKHVSRVLMLSGILFLPLAVGGGSGSEPQFKAVRVVAPPSPIWLPAARVLTTEGKVRVGVFDETSERILSRIASEPGIQTHSASAYAGACPAGYIGRNSDRLQPLPNDSLANLAQHAQGVYSGQIA